MAMKHLRKVQRVTQKVERAQRELEAAVKEAHESGEAIRDIAPYAKVSKSTLAQILQRAHSNGGRAEISSKALG